MRNFWERLGILLPIYRLVGRGLSDRDIANELNLTEGKVKSCISWMLRFLKLTNRLELVQHACSAAQQMSGTYYFPSSSLIRTANTGDNCNAPKDECSIVRSSWSSPYLTRFLRSDCDLQECESGVFHRFRYLHEGRIFQFEMTSISVAGGDARGTNSPPRRTDYFWLCDACALTMTLVVEPDAAVALVPVLGAVGKSMGVVRE